MTRTTVVSVALAIGLSIVAGCATEPPKLDQLAEGEQADLFNGKDLAGWTVVTDDIFYNATGPVDVVDGNIVLGIGREMTGLVWAGKPLTDNYRLSLQAKRVQGDDFFCGLVFPVRKGHVALILGGWGGAIVGLSNVDDMTAVDNNTTRTIQFTMGKWYDIEVEVVDNMVTIALDDKVIIEQEITDHRFNVWPQHEPTVPLGLTTYCTKGAYRNIVVRHLTPSPK